MFVSIKDRHTPDLDMKAYKIVEDWDTLNFFYMVVAIEHSVLLLKWGLEKFIDEVPS